MLAPVKGPGHPRHGWRTPSTGKAHQVRRTGIQAYEAGSPPYRHPGRRELKAEQPQISGVLIAFQVVP